MNRRSFLKLSGITGLLGVTAINLPKSNGLDLQTLTGTSEYNIPTPITLNGWTAVPLAGFSIPIPSSRFILASMLVFGSSNIGDGLQVAAYNIAPTPENVVTIIDASFSYNTVCSIGLVFIPVLDNDHLSLYFNTDPAAPLLQVVIRAVAYVG